MPETKTHQKFRSRIEYLAMYLEAMDAAARVTFNFLGRKNNVGKTIEDALPINSSNYSKLNHPVNHRYRVFNYCKSKNVYSSIVDVYGHFAEYVREILKEMYENKPLEVIGKSKKQLQLPYHEISKYTSISDLHNHMVEDVFRNMENERSTKKLIDKLIENTAVNISEAEIEDILPYFEMRHLIIHNKGKTDENFVTKYGGTYSVRINERLPSNFDIANKAVIDVSAFVKKLDLELLRVGIVAQI